MGERASLLFHPSYASLVEEDAYTGENRWESARFWWRHDNINFPIATNLMMVKRKTLRTKKSLACPTLRRRSILLVLQCNLLIKYHIFTEHKYEQRVSREFCGICVCECLYVEWIYLAKHDDAWVVADGCTRGGISSKATWLQRTTSRRDAVSASLSNQ